MGSHANPLLGMIKDYGLFLYCTEIPFKAKKRRVLSLVCLCSNVQGNLDPFYYTRCLAECPLGLNCAIKVS